MSSEALQTPHYYVYFPYYKEQIFDILKPNLYCDASNDECYSVNLFHDHDY